MYGKMTNDKGEGFTKGGYVTSLNTSNFKCYKFDVTIPTSYIAHDT